MLTIPCVVRLLDAESQILAWAEVLGEARGNGAVWARAPFSSVAERSGLAVKASVHWPDLHVHFETPIAPCGIRAGDAIRLTWPGALFMVQGTATPLPPVTVRQSVTIGVPTGGVGVRG